MAYTWFYHCRMISDFFHPVVGGVESHLFSLGAELIHRGHRVRELPNTTYHTNRLPLGNRYNPPSSPSSGCAIPPTRSQGVSPPHTTHRVKRDTSKLPTLPPAITKHPNSRIHPTYPRTWVPVFPRARSDIPFTLIRG